MSEFLKDVNDVVCVGGEFVLCGELIDFGVVVVLIECVCVKCDGVRVNVLLLFDELFLMDDDVFWRGGGGGLDDEWFVIVVLIEEVEVNVVVLVVFVCDFGFYVCVGIIVCVFFIMDVLVIDMVFEVII